MKQTTLADELTFGKKNGKLAFEKMNHKLKSSFWGAFRAFGVLRNKKILKKPMKYPTARNQN